MTKNELNTLFTSKVNEYLTKGYCINTTSMKGTHCSPKVDMVKDNHFVRVYIESCYRKGCDMEIIKVKHRNITKSDLSVGVVWDDTLEVIEEIPFYVINAKWYATEKEYQEIKEIRKKRKNNYPINFYYFSESQFPNQPKAKQIVLPYLRKQKGCKTIKLSEIAGVYKSCYLGRINIYIRAKGRRFNLL